MAARIVICLLGLCCCSLAWGQRYSDQLRLGVWTGQSELSAELRLCVTPGLYNVYAESSENNGRFRLRSGNDRMNYRVFWSETAGVRQTRLRHRRWAGPFWANWRGFFCRFGPNAFLSVQVRQGQLERAPAGAYSGQLYLLIYPE